MLEIIERKSSIDAVREVKEGVVLDPQEDLTVEFHDVHFCYPKRPDVKVREATDA